MGTGNSLGKPWAAGTVGWGWPGTGTSCISKGPSARPGPLRLPHPPSLCQFSNHSKIRELDGVGAGRGPLRAGQGGPGTGWERMNGWMKEGMSGSAPRLGTRCPLLFCLPGGGRGGRWGEPRRQEFTAKPEARYPGGRWAGVQDGSLVAGDGFSSHRHIPALQARLAGLAAEHRRAAEVEADATPSRLGHTVRGGFFRHSQPPGEG